MAKINLLDKKTRSVVSFKPSEAELNLKLEGDRYLPINSQDYIVRGKNGAFHKTNGKSLHKILGDTDGELVSADEYALETAVKAEYSQVGQFLKSALSETLFLGLNKKSALPTDSLSQAIELKRREMFGGAETGGTVAGSIIPFLAGGAGGILRAGAKAGAKSALKHAGKLPSAQVFNIAGKAGKTAKKGAEKLGIKNKSAQSVIGALGTGGAFAGMEAGLAGIQEARKTHAENEYKGTEETMKSVLGQGISKAGETFIMTGALMAITGGAGKAIALTPKALKAGASVAEKGAKAVKGKVFKGKQTGIVGDVAKHTLLSGVGYSLGGPAGAIGADAVAVGTKLLKRKAFHSMASRVMDKGQEFFTKSKTAKGVSWLLKTPYNAMKVPAHKANLSVSGLSAMFFGKSVNRLIDFEEQLRAIPEQERFIQGQDNLFSMVEQFGGRKNATNFVIKTGALKRDIVAQLPPISYDENGNKVYSNEDTNRFLKNINQGISPIGFVSAIRDQNVTQAGYEMFKRNYPDWLSDFNMNFLQGWKNKTIDTKTGSWYRQFLRSQDTTTSDFLYATLDRQREEQRTQVPRRMLRRQRPTISQEVTGGY